MSGEAKEPLAVALLYEAPDAPRVVAKGRGEVGRAILQTAREHGVPLQQNPELAEALSQIELDEHIPAELYKAVAVVIGFVLRASGQLKPRPGPRPPVRTSGRPG